MQITIATPLFPPDIGDPAPYIKVLASRLAETHQVTVVLFGHLPEQIESVTFKTADKRRSRFIRLLSFTKQLWLSAQSNDFLLIHNGPSTVIPALVVTLFIKTPWVYIVSDLRAHKNKNSRWLQLLHHQAIKRADHVINFAERPSLVTTRRPEILPFSPPPTEALTQYEKAWTEHHEQLETIFNHDT
jgi:hypothetical protein